MIKIARRFAFMLSFVPVAFVHAAPVPVEAAYALKYDIQDEHHSHLKSGEILLSKSYPTNGSMSGESINYVRDCQPSTSPGLSVKPSCEVAEQNVGDFLSFSLSSENHDAIEVITRIERGTFGGLANIEHRGYSSQQPITNGWYQTIQTRLEPGIVQTVKLQDGLTMTLTAAPQISD